MQNNDAKIFKAFIRDMRSGGANVCEGDDWIAFDKKKYLIIPKDQYEHAVRQYNERVMLHEGIYGRMS